MTQAESFADYLAGSPSDEREELKAWRHRGDSRDLQEFAGVVADFADSVLEMMDTLNKRLRMLEET